MAKKSCITCTVCFHWYWFINWYRKSRIFVVFSKLCREFNFHVIRLSHVLLNLECNYACDLVCLMATKIIQKLPSLGIIIPDLWYVYSLYACQIYLRSSSRQVHEVHRPNDTNFSSLRLNLHGNKNDIIIFTQKLMKMW